MQCGLVILDIFHTKAGDTFTTYTMCLESYTNVANIVLSNRGNIDDPERVLYDSHYNSALCTMPFRPFPSQTRTDISIDDRAI